MGSFGCVDVLSAFADVDVLSAFADVDVLSAFADVDILSAFQRDRSSLFLGLRGGKRGCGLVEASIGADSTGIEGIGKVKHGRPEILV